MAIPGIEGLEVGGIDAAAIAADRDEGNVRPEFAVEALTLPTPEAVLATRFEEAAQMFPPA